MKFYKVTLVRHNDSTISYSENIETIHLASIDALQLLISGAVKSVNIANSLEGGK